MLFSRNPWIFIALAQPFWGDPSPHLSQAILLPVSFENMHNIS